MLEQLKRLQAHLAILHTRVQQLTTENKTLTRLQQDQEAAQHAQLLQKNTLITQKQDDIDRANEELQTLKQQYEQLNHDATQLAERYGRLEKSTTDLKNRFQEILLERNELRIQKEKVQLQQRQTQQQLTDMQQDRDRLLHKNEQAKAKVEAIIQRLALLGTEQDPNALEIQALAHPNTDTVEDSIK